MWVIATLAGLAGLTIFVLCLPLDAALSIDTSGRPKFRLRLVWVFGLVSKEVKREKKEPEKKRKRRIGFRTISRILRIKGLLRQVKDLVRDVIGQLKIRELAVNLKLGLDNPADTGFLFASIGSITPFLGLPSRYQLRVQPSFYEEAVFEGYLHVVLRLWPIKLVRPFIRFVFSLAALRVVKILVLSKWKRKK